ncbi:MAG: MinD/ParA family protein [Anaerolineae bacterium]|nr:MinD/ParA family protein [Anaerolineae bacterium]
MTKVISIHSFRGGTGKSNISANVSSLLAQEGLRVGVVDGDIQSPGIHRLFSVAGKDLTLCLNHYLWGEAPIDRIAMDVTPNLGPTIKGKVFLLPSSIKANEIARVLKDRYDPGVLSQAFKAFIKACDLDVLMVDTHPGLNEETLLSLVLSDALGLVMRPDEQDYEGTAVTVEVARKLEVEQMHIILNKLPSVFDEQQVKARIEDAYRCPLAGIVPHSDDLMILSSDGVFSLRFPDHPLAARFRQIAYALYNGGE